MPASQYPKVLRRYRRKKRFSKETVLIEDREYDAYDPKGRFQRWVWTGVEFIYSLNITEEVLRERSKNSIPLAFDDLKPYPHEDDVDTKKQQNITSMLDRLRREMS
jgi:hypothetical protein